MLNKKFCEIFFGLIFFFGILFFKFEKKNQKLGNFVFWKFVFGKIFVEFFVEFFLHI